MKKLIIKKYFNNLKFQDNIQRNLSKMLINLILKLYNNMVQLHYHLFIKEEFVLLLIVVLQWEDMFHQEL